MSCNMIGKGVCVVQKPNSSANSQVRYTIIFMLILSFVCAVILSVLASALKKPQEIAKDLDRSKQMLMAAKILSPEEYFLVEVGDHKYAPAKYEAHGNLKEVKEPIYPSQDEILEVYANRIQPFLVNAEGEESTFEKQNINLADYLSDYKKSGYYNQPWKLLYKIFANDDKADDKDRKITGYVIPVNGMGLWDAIYGYLAIQTDGDTVIGISWYDQKETPGLGANISDPKWHADFPGKLIFQQSGDGKTDFKTAPLGIIVVKGKVSEVLGNSPKAKSAVDGMAGATLTGNGVTDAYKDVLAAYRPFLIKIHAASKEKE